jgi:tRNA pseudouridine55 synthase
MNSQVSQSHIDVNSTFASMDFEEGAVLLIDKPYRWTSFDVVGKVRGALRKKLGKKNIKVGHAGTLDPLATGLLILCTGKFTKKIDEYQAQEKEYTGTFFVGATTPCYDLEKPVDKHFPTDHITEEMIYTAAKKFTGTIEQVPPLFSAVWVDGKRAYELAREGKEAEVKAKTVTISEFEITGIQLPEVHFRVVCSKGTYIRSLARDFGAELGSGGHLTALCRTRIGSFRLDEAQQLPDLITALSE